MRAVKSNSSNISPDEQRGVNVKVIVRCRPTSELEKNDSSQYQVITPRVDAKEVFVSQTIPGRKIDSYSKTFTFDGVCSQYTSQAELFNIYVIPIVEEVLLGFNCTIFAYGQTGTGKTYTMEGDIYSKAATPNENLLHNGKDNVVASSGLYLNSSSTVRSEPTKDSGIIPRAVQYIFDKLESQDAEYTVRVSYLEIYNEELNDLLNDGEKQHLRIFEDPGVKKGLAVDKLEEISVSNPQDILNVLCIAVKKRHTAETLLNRQSSRSHCIFSVTIHMKEANIDGEDIIKIGKLNLVDLAGSENIHRSGANTMKDRAKEAGLINQSLLTLGRVINALVERASYIPYRDSKLTRLLQESLGGRTKTCIIATVSPSSMCLEETLFTLDYAFRAKNIRNRPEINQKMTKHVMIRELNQEIERLKVELQTNREKHGVYLPLERFSSLQNQAVLRSIEIKDANEEIDRLKHKLEQKTSDIIELEMQLKNEHEARCQTKFLLDHVQHCLDEANIKIKNIERRLVTEQNFNAQLKCQEQKLQHKYNSLLNQLDRAMEQIQYSETSLKNSTYSGKCVIERVLNFLSHILNTFLKSMKIRIDAAFYEWQNCSEKLKTTILDPAVIHHTSLQKCLESDLLDIKKRYREQNQALAETVNNTIGKIESTWIDVFEKLNKDRCFLHATIDGVVENLEKEISSLEKEMQIPIEKLKETLCVIPLWCQKQKQSLSCVINDIIKASEDLGFSIETETTKTGSCIDNLTFCLEHIREESNKVLHENFAELMRLIQNQSQQMLKSCKTLFLDNVENAIKECFEIKASSKNLQASAIGQIKNMVASPLNVLLANATENLDDFVRCSDEAKTKAADTLTNLTQKYVAITNNNKAQLKESLATTLTSLMNESRSSSIPLTLSQNANEKLNRINEKLAELSSLYEEVYSRSIWDMSSLKDHFVACQSLQQLMLEHTSQEQIKLQVMFTDIATNIAYMESNVKASRKHFEDYHQSPKRYSTLLSPLSLSTCAKGDDGDHLIFDDFSLNEFIHKKNFLENKCSFSLPNSKSLLKTQITLLNHSISKNTSVTNNSSLDCHLNIIHPLHLGDATKLQQSSPVIDVTKHGFSMKPQEVTHQNHSGASPAKMRCTQHTQSDITEEHQVHIDRES